MAAKIDNNYRRLNESQYDDLQIQLKSDDGFNTKVTNIIVIISIIIEIITNRIEINEIYQGEVVSNSNGCINPRDYIHFNRPGKMVSNSNDGSNTRDLIYFSISHD